MQSCPPVLLAFWLLLPLAVQPQMIGVPFVEAYPKEQYGYGTQNWDIAQGPTGLLYFANNEGLLEFDGADWRRFPLPNRTILRSLLIRDGRIYAGGQNEFGVYRPDARRKWRFESWKARIPAAHRDFEDVWEITAQGDRIYFLASGKLYVWRGDTCRVLPTPPIRFFGAAGDRLYAQGQDGRCYTLAGDTLAPLPGTESLTRTEIRRVIARGEQLLLATHRHGLFSYDGAAVRKWSYEGENFFNPRFINTAAVLADGDIVLGTGFQGVVVVGPDGRFKYRVGTADGLANNRVICTFVDRQHNLWLGLDNGISMVRTNSPFSRLYPRDELAGAGYDVAIANDRIYLGVSSGLLTASWSNHPITDHLQLVPGTDGQVWGIDVIDDRVLLSHQGGAFLVREDIATPFYDATGVWLFQPDRYRKDLLLSGTYRGISFFDRAGPTFRYELPGLAESSRFVVQDRSGAYWMAHPYRGIYRIQHPHDPARRTVERLGPAQGLPSDLHNHVFAINDEILICGERGIFTFDTTARVFRPYEPIERYLGSEVKVRRLFAGPDGDVWFVTANEIGVLDVEVRGLTREIHKRVFPELLPLLNGGWERIYAYDEDHVFIATVNGFVHYDARRRPPDSTRFEVVVHEVVINKDSLFYPTGEGPPLTLPHDQNTLLFKVAATDYVYNETVAFQYQLPEVDADWSPPGPLRAKEYTNLPPGDYTLRVRAVNSHGTYSPVATFSFHIARPWYATNWARGLFVFLLLLTGFLVYRRIGRKYAALRSEVDTTVQQSRAEIQRLETEKVQAQLDHKKRELVSATLHLVQKNETIADIVDRLDEIRKASREDAVQHQLQKLMHALKKAAESDEGWEQAMYHFNELHADFFDRLKAAHPDLTPKDLRICAYLKMNLSSKEMASLMNISLRGVEASRYRLRKKLDLPSEANLTEFLMGA